MNIKITHKILSIPPYVSTSWSGIAALHMKGPLLAVTLTDGDVLHIPDLNTETIRSIFEHHAAYLDSEQSKPIVSHPSLTEFQEMMEQNDPPIRFAFGTSMDGFGNMMQHNPNQANAPDLPAEILQKIGAISKIISPPEEMVIPKSEPGCNCFFCQIARALNPENSSPDLLDELIIADKDLEFQQWDIRQTGEKLYAVVNRLDEHEKYNVYLGEPIGCTCGKADCEHILVVLKS